MDGWMDGWVSEPIEQWRFELWSFVYIFGLGLFMTRVNKVLRVCNQDVDCGCVVTDMIARFRFRVWGRGWVLTWGKINKNATKMQH